MKGVAVLIGLLAASLGGMWAHFAHHNALTGDVPAGSRSVETDTVVHLGMALDLTLLVPLYAGSAVLLWRRSPWGFVLGMIALLAGLLHQLSYMVAMPIQVAAGIPGASSYDAGEPVIVSLYLLGILLLLRPIRRGTRWQRDTCRSTEANSGAPKKDVVLYVLVVGRGVVSETRDVLISSSEPGSTGRPRNGALRWGPAWKQAAVPTRSQLCMQVSIDNGMQDRGH
jgi:hypothetical protein